MPDYAGCRYEVRCGNQRFDLVVGQERDGFVLETLPRYCQDALDQGTHAWFVESRIAEEGVYRRQAGITRAGTITALLLEVLQEGADQGCIQIL